MKQFAVAALLIASQYKLEINIGSFNDSSFLLILPFKTGPYMHILFFSGGMMAAGGSLDNIIDEMGHSFD